MVMKNTIVMLAFIGTFLLTWIALSIIVFGLSEDITFRQAASHGGVGMIMFIFGWIPALIVSIDIDTKLTK